MSTADLSKGYEGKREGQARAASASSEWLAAAKQEILRRVVNGEEVTAQDIVTTVGMPESKGAVGTAFSHLARSKQIEWTGRIQPCPREEAHASDMRVWRVYQGTQERNAAIIAKIGEWDEPSESTLGFGTRLSRAEKNPRGFMREIMALYRSDS
jgi:alkylated DNA nucleotide flippase Atl1